MPPPAGLVAWWTGDGDASDAVGPNHAILHNGAEFAAGMVGLGFALDGVDDFVLIPDSPTLRLTNEVTFELWFKGESPNWGGIIDKRSGTVGANYGLTIAPGWGVQLYYNDPNVFGGDHPGNIFEIAAHLPLPTLNEFHHFAGTYRQVDAEHIELKMYIDGVLAESRTFAGNLAATLNSAPIAIGGVSGTCCFFKGIIDEVSLYNRTLTATEVEAIHAAGAAGKCKVPVAPEITVQPQSQAVFAGETATFAVTASGTRPLSYQWRFKGDPVAAATNASLVLLAVQPAQAGDYSVVVSNAAGESASDAATLTVSTNLPSCVPVPEGLVSWWTGDGHADDLLGENPGQLRNGASFVPGKVGQGFSLDGIDDYVLIPDSPSLRLTDEVTFEMWFKAESSSWGGIFDKRGWTHGANYGLIISTDWGVQLYYNDPNVFGGDHPGNTFEIAAHFPLPSLSEFHHFAGTYQQVDATHIELKMYIDGVLLETRAFAGNLANTLNNAPVAIGAVSGSCCNFRGIIDEVSLYNRELTPAEIQAIYGAGSAGKCKTISPTPPQISSQPQNQTVPAGENATFTVTAGGSRPLSYQWRFNGDPISGATEARLVLSNAQVENAGDYTVVVSNLAGLVASDVASLTVNTNPPVCVPLPDGLIGWWTGDGDANDLVGSNHGEIHGSASFAPAKVGLGFTLDGMDDFVLIPDTPSLRLTNEVTFELWFKAESPNWGGLLDKRVDPWGANYGLFVSQQYGVQHYYNDPHVYGGDYANNIHEISAYFPLPSLNVFHHFAGTYQQVDSNHVELKTYIDGQQVRTRVFEGNLANTLNSAPLAIGAASGVCCYFQGIIDEVSLYNRTLTTEEIAGIYLAGAAGKCKENLAPRIIHQPRDVTVLVGTPAVFNVDAVGSAPLNFQWNFNGGAIASATSSSYRIPGVQPVDAGAYSVTISNAAGSITSGLALLTVDTNVPVVVPPTIVSQPTNQTTIEGGSATFQVVATGSAPLSYQWRFAGADLPGAIRPTLLLSGVQVAQAGVYSVRVSNNAGSVLSDEATLTVAPDRRPPVILQQPVSHNVAPGGNTTFSVAASGAAPLIYQWQFNEMDLSGANDSILTILSAQEGNAGSYTLVVSNAFGYAVSDEAVLTVTNVLVAGTVNFANRGGAVNAPVFDTDGTTLLYGPNYRAELLAGPTETMMGIIGATASFPVPGYFVGGIRSIPGVAAGQVANVQVRVWDLNNGTNYGEALTNGGKVGASSIISVTTGGGGIPPGLPSNLIGLESFSLRQGIAPAPVAAYLSPGRRPGNGSLEWLLHGQSDTRYAVECSTNLVDWAGLMIVTPVNGVASFNDQFGAPCLYYRARLLQ